ncbi:MAG: hypothetical protein LH609_16695 [Rudanella sp.]|nr:hypothetical protein [Rudanella sp.]
MSRTNNARADLFWDTLPINHSTTNNSFFTAPKSSRVDTAQPAGATKPYPATTVHHLIMLAVALILVAGCNAKTTTNGGTKADPTAQADTRPVWSEGDSFGTKFGR